MAIFAFKGLKNSNPVRSPAPTIRHWVKTMFPKTQEFPCPTVSLLNGEPVLRKSWDEPLRDDDEVTFIVQPGWDYIIYAIIAIVVAYAAVEFLVPSLETKGELGDPDPVYSLTGQRNQNRFGSVIEDPYGYQRLWPSKAAQEYTVYFNNQQDIFILLCLGQGVYDLENAVVQIEDTDIDDFEDVIYAFYEPGEAVTLFPDNVESSDEVGSTELYAPNEGEYSGYTGPFVANSSGTDTNRLEVDLVFPQGLYFAADDGTLETVNVQVNIQYREIDDLGDPVGAGTWSNFTSFSKTLKTNTPQRFTISQIVSSGRYEVRVARTTNANLTEGESHRTIEAVHWTGLRAYLPSTKDYGDVTLLAIRARATNNLNNKSANRINVITTRKLPIWNGTTWSAPAVTRSPVWAFCNILRAEYNLNLEDTYLDLAGLLTRANVFELNGIYFDFTFDNQASAWNRLTVIAQAAGALPLPLGAQVTMVLDEYKTVPKGVYTKENILKDSLNVDYNLFTDTEHDGVEVEYEDYTTHTKKTLLCVAGTQAGDRPKPFKAIGVKDRTRAWRLGMRKAEAMAKRRVVLDFVTGLEGIIPDYNDLIHVSHSLFGENTQSGRVINYGFEGPTLVLFLDTDLDWSEVGTYKIGFITKTGEEIGPIDVVERVNPNEVEIDELDLGDDVENVFQIDGSQDYQVFIFGIESERVRACRLAAIDPGDSEEVQMTGIEDNADVYSHDAETPSADDTGTVPAKVPDLPVVTGLFARDIPGRATMSQISWNKALGAHSYVLEVSYDNTNWETLTATTATFFEMPVQAAQQFYFRVAGINAGRGPWETWSGVLGDTSGINDSGVLIDPDLISATVPLPSVSPQSMSWDFGTNGDLTISASVSSGTIYYTTDGNPVTTNSAIWSGDVDISGTTEMRFRTLSSSGFWSEEVKRTFTATTQSNQQTATPSFYPTYGNGTGGSTVLSCATSGATIYYKVVAGFPGTEPTRDAHDGGANTGGWSTYGSSVTVPSGTQTVWAYAWKSGFVASGPTVYVSN